MKRNDIILLAGILLVAALLAGIGHMTHKSEKGTLVVVSVRGKEYATYALSEHRTEEIPGVIGNNRLAIRDGVVRMEAAVCPDHYCMKQGEISKAGEQIICLPNGIVVEIVGEKTDGLDGIVY